LKGQWQKASDSTLICENKYVGSLLAEDEKGLIVCHEMTDIGFVFIGITVLAPKYSRTHDLSRT
jgi:hypothetical protein